MNEILPRAKRAEASPLLIEIPSDAPIYDRKTDVPQVPLRYLFNSGHVRNQLNPFLPEMASSYGAVPFKIKNESGSGFQIYVGIEPEKLFEWFKTKIYRPELQTTWVHLRLALMESFAKEWTTKARERVAAGTIDQEAAKKILFGMRQQLGQYFTLEGQIAVVEEQIRLGLVDFASQRIELILKNIEFSKSQFAAAEIFIKKLVELIEKPDVSRVLMAIPDFVFELNVAKEMLEGARKNLAQEPWVRERVEQLSEEIASARGPQVATPPQTE